MLDFLARGSLAILVFGLQRLVSRLEVGKLPLDSLDIRLVDFLDLGDLAAIEFRDVIGLVPFDLQTIDHVHEIRVGLDE